MKRLGLPETGRAEPDDLKEAADWVENLDDMLENPSKQKGTEDEVSVHTLKNLFFMVNDDEQWARLVKNYQDLNKT